MPNRQSQRNSNGSIPIREKAARSNGTRRIELLVDAMRRDHVDPVSSVFNGLQLDGERSDDWWEIIGNDRDRVEAFVNGSPFDEDVDVGSDSLAPLTLAELAAKYPNRATPVVDGLVRRGETMNIIAAPKVGKTWFAHGLARCVALGKPFLGFPTIQGKVLICDAELHPPELRQRLEAVLGSDADTTEIMALPLRGEGLDLFGLADLLYEQAPPGRFATIVVDALYRFLPDGVSENDNSQITRLYNVLDKIARHTDAAIVVVHHSSKGDQSGKSVTDFGAGAGAISRAADTHIAIRPHEEDGLAVLQAVTRSFAQPDDRSIRWEYPHWERVPWVPKIATRKTAADERQRQLDREADDAIRRALGEEKLSISQLRGITNMGQDRVQRSLNRLGAQGRVAKNKRTGKTCERYSLPKKP